MDPNVLDILQDSIRRKRNLKAPDVTSRSSKATSDGAAHVHPEVSKVASVHYVDK